MATKPQNPYAAPQSLAVPPVTSRQPRQAVWLARACMLQLLVIAVGLTLEAYEHESIVGSGPVFATVGLLIGILSLRRQNLLGIITGFSAVSLTLLIIVLINALGWGPAQGDGPISMMLYIYCPLAAAALAKIAFGRESETVVTAGRQP